MGIVTYRSLLVFVFLLYFFSISSATDVTSCQVLSSSDTYNLTQNVTTTGTCFTITANNINLSCNGYNITGDGGNAIDTDNGINISASNASVYDCFISRLDNGFYFNTSSTGDKVVNNTINGTTGGNGITLTGGVNSPSIINNFINNSALNGISLTSSGAIGVNITSTIIRGSASSGISITGTGSGSNITNVISFSNTLHGILFSSEVDPATGNIRFENNSAQNNTGNGFVIQGGDYGILILNNSAYNNSAGYAISGFGIQVFNNSATNNTVGFLNRHSVAATHNSSFISNVAYNSQAYGFVFDNVSTVNLTENNASNSSAAQFFVVNNSRVTFQGINRALNSSLVALDFNITRNGTVYTLFSGTYYNFTTSFGSIFLGNATNVTIKLMNQSNSGVNTTGCVGFTGTCTLVTPDLNIVNISNVSGPGVISLGVFYNISQAPTSSNVYVSSYNFSSGGWLQVGQTTVDGTIGSVRYDGISVTNSFLTTFAAVNFATSSSTSTATSSSSGGSNPYSGKREVPTPTLDYSCDLTKVKASTLPEFKGGTMTMQYYCNAVCGPCNFAKVGSHASEDSIDDSGSSIFDYYGPGEYDFAVNGVGQSTNYRPTLQGSDLSISCYQPTLTCASKQSSESIKDYDLTTSCLTGKLLFKTKDTNQLTDTFSIASTLNPTKIASDLGKIEIILSEAGTYKITNERTGSSLDVPFICTYDPKINFDGTSFEIITTDASGTLIPDVTVHIDKTEDPNKSKDVACGYEFKIFSKGLYHALVHKVTDISCALTFPSSIDLVTDETGKATLTPISYSLEYSCLTGSLNFVCSDSYFSLQKFSLYSSPNLGTTLASGVGGFVTKLSSAGTYFAKSAQVEIPLDVTCDYAIEFIEQGGTTIVKVTDIKTNQPIKNAEVTVTVIKDKNKTPPKDCSYEFEVKEKGLYAKKKKVLSGQSCVSSDLSTSLPMQYTFITDEQGTSSFPPGGDGSVAVGNVFYNLITNETSEVGDNHLVFAVKDNQPCAFCTLIITDPKNVEYRFTTDAEGRTMVSLPYRGNYHVVLLTKEGILAKEKQVMANLNLDLDKVLKKPAVYLADSTIQMSLLLVLIIIMLILAYFYKRRRDAEKKKKYRKEQT